MSFVSDPTRLLTPLMQLTAYKKIERGAGDKVSTLLIPYDAESMASSFMNKVCDTNVIGSASGSSAFQKSSASTLDITFVLDDTTYSNLVAFALPPVLIPDSVDKIIKKLLELSHSIAGSTHEPYYLTLKPLNMPLVNSPAGGFRCRLTTIQVENKIINLLGNRVKAYVKCSFKECLSKKQMDASTKKNSPDLTHVRQVFSGENLPLKSYRIYEDPAYYLALAEYNGLDSFRDLEVGKPLVFPPLER